MLFLSFEVVKKKRLVLENQTQVETEGSESDHLKVVECRVDGGADLWPDE